MGQINIGGANAAVQLQGNDTITTDQAFSFPPQGGQLVCYQQGIFTPSMYGYNATWGTYSKQEGTYSRVGQTVYITMYVGAPNTNSSSSAVLISGFPYEASKSIGTVYNSADIGYALRINTPNPFTAYLDGLTRISLVTFGTNDASVSPLPCTAFSDGSSRVILSCNYITDDITWQPINGAAPQGTSEYAEIKAAQAAVSAAYVAANPSAIEELP